MSFQTIRVLYDYVDTLPGGMWFYDEETDIQKQFPPVVLHKTFHDYVKNRLLDAAVVMGDSQQSADVLKLVRDVHAPCTVRHSANNPTDANRVLAPAIVAMLKALDHFEGVIVLLSDMGEQLDEVRTALKPMRPLLTKAMAALPKPGAKQPSNEDAMDQLRKAVLAAENPLPKQGSASQQCPEPERPSQQARSEPAASQAD